MEREADENTNERMADRPDRGVESIAETPLAVDDTEREDIGSAPIDDV